MLNKIKVKLAQFMQGRYGIDYLYVAGIILYFVLSIVQIFAQIRLLNILLSIFIIWIFYRVFSKNISSRRAENQRFMKWISKLQRKVKPIWQRIRHMGTHRYRKCPECGVTLRLPLKRGRRQVVCPKCQNRFEVTIRM